MDLDLLKYLRCPKSGQNLVFHRSSELPQDRYTLDGWLVSEDGYHRYPIRVGIPRFVPESNYANNFGMQWNYFSKTQLDSHSGHQISADRFWKATGWKPEEMKDKWVLDVGCGSGRFAEVALSAGAHVVALDYSTAVDACYNNLRHHKNLHVIQADIYSLPLAQNTFPFIYSIGVLQHTPNVPKAFAMLPPMLCGGGKLCVDYYEKSAKSFFLPKYWLRPITKRLPKKLLFEMLQKIVPILLPISRVIRRVPVFGKTLYRLIPVANYEGVLPLTTYQLKEWALLDTFDWLSPAYDNPQTKRSAQVYMEQSKMERIEVLNAGHLVVRGQKPIK